MSALFKKGQKCWLIRQHGMFPTITACKVTSSVHAGTLRVRWGTGVNAVTRTVNDIDVFHTELDACRKLVQRLAFESELWQHRISDIRYEQMEVSK